MIVDPANTPYQDIYKLLIGVVQPRPIAWVSTLSPKGIANLAPFSFFTAIGSNPPAICFSNVVRDDGTHKDTWINIKETGEFVVNVVTEEVVTLMNQTSANYAYEVSEIEATGLTPLPSDLIKPYRIAESPIHLECKLLQMVDVGEGPGSASLIIGQVVKLHLDDRVCTNGRVDVAKLRPVGRLAGANYCHVNDWFELRRPATP